MCKIKTVKLTFAGRKQILLILLCNTTAVILNNTKLEILSCCSIQHQLQAPPTLPVRIEGAASVEHLK